MAGRPEITGWLQALIALAVALVPAFVMWGSVTTRVSATEETLSRIRTDVREVRRDINEQIRWRASTEQILINLTDKINESLRVNRNRRGGSAERPDR